MYEHYYCRYTTTLPSSAVRSSHLHLHLPSSTISLQETTAVPLRQRAVEEHAHAESIPIIQSTSDIICTREMVHGGSGPDRTTILLSGC
nr:hypothetical protein CFP56_67820 [Quercus suber]